MDARHRPYRIEDSDARITEILESAATFDDQGAIPNGAALTYSNGFYVECTAIFIDIRGSSKLSEKYAQRRTLGKLYRAYVSECVAVLNGNPRCSQVFIQGDCVSAVFDTPNRDAINDVFRLVAMLNSVVKLLNYRLERRNLAPIQVGIGIDAGRALMLKAGFNGSGINDIIWMGDVLNQASHLCHSANKDGRLVIQVSEAVHAALNQEAMSADGKKFVTQKWRVLLDTGGWECDVVNVGMERHLEELIRQQQAADQLLKPKGLLDELAALFAAPPQPAPAAAKGLLDIFATPLPAPAEPTNALLALIQRQK